MKKMLTVLFLVSLLVSMSFGANWAWQDTISNETVQSYSNGMTVDDDGKIWYISYFASDSIEVDTTGDGTPDTWESCRAIQVFNPDGSEASFSPIKTLTYTYDGSHFPELQGETFTDTLWGSNYGIRNDPSSNSVIYSNYTEGYRINQQTGECMDRFVPYPYDTSGVLAAETGFNTPGVDENGNVFVCSVYPGYPIKIYDSNLDFVNDALSADDHSAYSRCIEVSPDGKDIYYCGYTGSHGFIRFHANTAIWGDYHSQVDSLLPGMAVEAAAFQPGTGYIWGGNSGGANYTNCGWYALDPETDTVVDSITADPIPSIAALGVNVRGIGFSPGGDTMYVAYYNSWDTEAVYIFVKDETAVDGWKHTGTISTNFELGENYPNPFNPTTTIPLKLNKQTDVKLVIYDAAGNKVQTIVNKTLSPGRYEYNFNATGLASGTYFYRLFANGQVSAKKMMYIK